MPSNASETTVTLKWVSPPEPALPSRIAAWPACWLLSSTTCNLQQSALTSCSTAQIPDRQQVSRLYSTDVFESVLNHDLTTCSWPPCIQPLACGLHPANAASEHDLHLAFACSGHAEYMCTLLAAYLVGFSASPSLRCMLDATGALLAGWATPLEELSGLEAALVWTAWSTSVARLSSASSSM